MIPQFEIVVRSGIMALHPHNNEACCGSSEI
jgi:hypothetical protein